MNSSRRHPFAPAARIMAVLCLFACGATARLAAASSADDPNQVGPRKPYALIVGTVYDSHSRPLAGVKIKIRRANQKKAQWEHYSDARGEFAQRFAAGEMDYVVWADLKDKQAAAKSEVTVHMENDERHDISLHLNINNGK